MKFGIKEKKGKARRKVSKQGMDDMRRRLGLAGINYLESKFSSEPPPHHVVMISPLPGAGLSTPTSAAAYHTHRTPATSEGSSPIHSAIPVSPNIYERLTYTAAVEERLRKSCTSTKPRNSETLQRLHALKDVLDDVKDRDGSVMVNELEGIFQSPVPHLCNETGYVRGSKISTASILIDACRNSTVETNEKVRFVFDLFDTSGTNTITKAEVMQFLAANYKKTEVQLNGTTFKDIVDNIFSRYGEGDDNDQLDFEQFRDLFEDIVLGENPTEAVEVKSLPKKHQNPFLKYIYRRKTKATCLALYLMLNGLLFALKAMQYNYDTVTGYCAPMAKGFAQLAVLNTMFAILPMCREIVQFLRQLPVLWRYIPFDENIEFHKICGVLVVVSGVAHTVFWIIIVYFIRSATALEMQESGFKGLDFIRTSSIGELSSMLPIWTGVGMILCFLIAIPFTHQRLRQGNFNIFWFTHMLFLPYLLLVSIHGAASWVNSPQAYLWVVGPVVLYFLERRYRFGKVFGGRTSIVKVEVATDMVALFMEKPKRFDMNFRPGMYLYLNIPILSRFEWHPFTISSAPEDEYLSVHIRRNGDWTNALHSLISSMQQRAEKLGTLKTIEYPVAILDGPVGAPSQEYYRHKVAILIGAGIGVTPFASILKSIMNMWEDNRCLKCGVVGHPRNFQLQKIYFYWVTREQESLTWFSDTMNQLSEMDVENRLELHNYYSPINRQSLAAPLQLLQTLVHNEEGHCIISGLNTKNVTHFGRPEWKSILRNIAASHPAENIGVFLCGPPKLDEAVSDECHEYNLDKLYDVEFSYHSENF